MEKVHLIDGDGQFTPTLPDALQSWEVWKNGTDYSVVAVLGPQSSGKSAPQSPLLIRPGTLMNLLFGCTFDVMDDTLGRYQVTKGLWLSRAKGFASPTLLVMDVEGTDSKERGEVDAKFERKAALFSLALADVLLVNMWYTDVGRYQASNYGLLKTVFEANLQLFHQETKKTLLMFVIRDHHRTELSKLEEMIKADVQRIWSEITKPKGLEAAQMDTFFDFAFFSLPHKFHREDDFIAGVSRMRTLFNEDDLLKPAYRRAVPMDGFSHYANEIWDTVQANKDLDLPSQREMLAMFRCDEIAEAALSLFRRPAEDVRVRLVDGQVVDEFGQLVTTLKATTLEEYDIPASRYHRGVFSARRHKLDQTVTQELYRLFETQLGNVAARSIAAFEGLLKNGLAKEKTCDLFATVVSGAREKVEALFVDKAKSSLLAESDWEYESALNDLRRRMAKRISAARDSQVHRCIAQQIEEADGRVGAHLGALVSDSPPDLWNKITAIHSDSLAGSQKPIQAMVDSFGATQDESEEWELAVATGVSKSMMERLRTAANSMPLMLRKRFDDTFRYDEHRVPRVWQKGDEVRAVYVASRDAALGLIALYSECHADLPGVTERLLIAPTRRTELREQFEREATAAFMEAQRMKDSVMALRGIPPFFYVLLAVLGFNEFMALLRNPLLLILVLVVGATAYMLHNMGLLNPAIRASTVVLKRVMKQ